MPFQSRAQERWAHAKGKPWAKEASEKTDHDKLPEKKGSKKKKKGAGGKAKSRKRS